MIYIKIVSKFLFSIIFDICQIDRCQGDEKITKKALKINKKALIIE